DSLWLDTECGLARISKEDVDGWWRDDSATVAPEILDALDGVQPGRPSFNPMVRTPDGRLWIVNKFTLQVVDPGHLTSNNVIPTVQIEKAIADRTPYQLNDKLTFPPLILDLEIDYAALSFVSPQKVRFRYRLEGRDTAWQEAGNRRQAFYTDLRPGSYRFRVMACNNSGIWNETGTYLDFYIAPAYYQTTWFRVLIVAGVLLLLAVLYQMRVRQIAAQVRARLEERVEERERIARDLHDTLLQSVQGLILSIDAAAQQIPPDQPAHQDLEKTLD